jgi:hypothetical protein
LYADTTPEVADMDTVTIVRWCIGVVGVSVVAGVPLSYLWYAILCWIMGIVRKLPFIPRIPLKETGVLTGAVERVFFTISVAMDLSGTAIAMVAWVAAKNSILWPGFTKEGNSAQGTVSLLTSIGSMLIALLGAAVCKGKFF